MIVAVPFPGALISTPDIFLLVSACFFSLTPVAPSVTIGSAPSLFPFTR